MNIAEAQLLTGGLDNITNVLLRKRAAEQQALEHGQELDLRREELGLRRGDLADARSTRQAALEAQAAHQQRLEALQKEGNADKRAEMGLKFLSELNKSGQLTDDGLARMEQVFNDKLGGTGLGVKLFRAPEAKTPAPYESPTGTPYTVYGNTILRDTDPRADVTLERDDVTGELRPKTIRQRMKPEEIGWQGGGDEAAGPNPQQQREIDAILRAPAIPAGGPARVPGAAPVQPVLPTVSTKADFDALPSGAKYINAKDGRTYTKP